MFRPRGMINTRPKSKLGVKKIYQIGKFKKFSDEIFDASEKVDENRLVRPGLENISDTRMFSKQGLSNVILQGAHHGDKIGAPTQLHLFVRPTSKPSFTKSLKFEPDLGGVKWIQ